MQTIPKSGLYYPNKIARFALLALDDVIGRNGLKAVLNLACLPNLIENLPPDNLDREFDFSEFSAINGALIEIFGSRGSRSLAERAGRATFNNALSNFGALAGTSDVAFRVLPISIKLRIGLPALAKIFSASSDQLSTVFEQDNEYIFTLQHCPVCWGRQTDKPACFIATGMLQAALVWFTASEEFRVTQTTAKSCADENCQFVINKDPIP